MKTGGFSFMFHYKSVAAVLASGAALLVMVVTLASQPVPVVEQADVLAAALSFRAQQLGDSARLSECGLSRALGLSPEEVRAALPFERSGHQLLPCRYPDRPQMNTLVLLGIDVTERRKAVRVEYYVPSGGLRTEEHAWGPDVGTFASRQEIRFYGFRTGH
jgi:hypothetical protein